MRSDIDELDQLSDCQTAYFWRADSTQERSFHGLVVECIPAVSEAVGERWHRSLNFVVVRDLSPQDAAASWQRTPEIPLGE